MNSIYHAPACREVFIGNISKLPNGNPNWDYI
jgi:hypothetical protein